MDNGQGYCTSEMDRLKKFMLNLLVDGEVDDFGPRAIMILEGVLRPHPVLAQAACVNEALKFAEPEPHVVQVHQLAEYAGARICKWSRRRKGGGINDFKTY